MSLLSPIARALRLCGGADNAILAECSQGEQAITATQGAVALAIAGLSAFFFANIWLSITKLWQIAALVYVLWFIIIIAFNSAVAYVRDRPGPRKWSTALGAFGMLSFCTAVVGANLIFTLLLVFGPEISDTIAQEAIDRMKPVELAWDHAQHVRDDGVVAANLALAQAQDAYAKGTAKLDADLADATASLEALNAHQASILNNQVAALTAQLAEANNRHSAEVIGELRKGAKGTTGWRGDGTAAAAVEQEIGRITDLLDRATKERDAFLAQSPPVRDAAVVQLKTRRDDAAASLANMRSAAIQAHDKTIEDLEPPFATARAVYERDRTEVRRITADGFRARFDALKVLVRQDPLAVVAFGVLMLAIETMGFWFTFIPRPEYRHRLRVRILGVEQELHDAETTLRRKSVHEVKGGSGLS